MIEKIIRIIEQKGVTQDAVERAAGLPQGRISKWVNGTGEPTITQASRLARYLDLPLEFLADDSLDEPGQLPGLSEQERTLLFNARVIGLDEAMRRLLYVGTGVVPRYPYDPAKARGESGNPGNG